MTATAYGASKAALNWITKNVHIENPELIAFPIILGKPVLLLYESPKSKNLKVQPTLDMSNRAIFKFLH